ncbi:MAG TPA: MTH1187 family thiamine-binding protein [Planctomycetes bacterium]|nr:MTH1187 family thiamine-binding protein [Planctomycetota bacterium]
MVVLEFSIFPLDKGESLSEYVAHSLDIVDSSGLDYQCHAMGTILEGEYDQVMDVVKRCFERMAADCRRIECSIKFDYRQGYQGRLKGKVARVEERLGRPVRK